MNTLHLIFPKALYCISCGRPLPFKEENSLALCERCAGEIEWITKKRCRKCGRPLSDENLADLCHECVRTQEQSFSKGYACALYSGRAAELIRDIKYREKVWYEDTISALMAERYFSEADAETGELPSYDFIIAVPMAAKKREIRGYDQAELFARGLSRRIGVPYLPKALLRVRETDAMSNLSAEERRSNLAFAFSVAYDRIDRITMKRVLLVDDVYTTGSSVSTCADTLIAAGAALVDFIVFAIGADFCGTEGRSAVIESPSQLRAKGPT